MISFAGAEGVLVFCLALSLLFYTAIFVERKNKNNIMPQSTSLETHLPSWKEKILQELAFLEGPFHLEKPKEAMTQFSVLVDTYIRQAFGFDPTPFTTSETMQFLSQKIPQEESQKLESIRFLLTESDWVKFSREESKEEQWQKLFSVFKGLLSRE
jgi:hypothetical protein